MYIDLESIGINWLQTFDVIDELANSSRQNQSIYSYPTSQC